MTELTFALGEVLGDGREAVVYALDETRVLKVFRDLPDAAARADREFAIAALLHEHGVGVAEPIEVTSRGGQPALISRRVEGVSLNAVLARAPWRVARIARRLAATQVALHAVTPPPGLDELRDVITARLRSGGDARLTAAALRALESLPRGASLCHGNAHLGNVVMSGDDCVLVDCGDATIGEPLAEVAQTLVRYRCARLRPGAPLTARLGSAIGRRLLAFFYLRAYRRLRGVDDAALARWVGVRAVERMAEGHRHERRRLARLALHRLV